MSISLGTLEIYRLDGKSYQTFRNAYIFSEDDDL
jgi:hypothetical protein